MSCVRAWGMIVAAFVLGGCAGRANSDRDRATSRSSEPRPTKREGPVAKSEIKEWRPVVATKSGNFVIDPARGGREKLPDSLPHGVISPDGRRVIFKGTPPELQESFLYVADVRPESVETGGRSDVRPIVQALEFVRDFQWMPDSRHVVFASGRPVARRAWLIDMFDTTGWFDLPARTLLTPEQRSCWNPQAAADGTIAYVALCEERGKEVLVDLIIRDGAKVAGCAFVLGVAWSPDSKQLAYSKPDAVCIYDVASKQTRTIGLPEIQPELRNCGCHHLAWRLDGTALAGKPEFLGGRMEGTQVYAHDKLLLIPMGAEAGRGDTVAKTQIVTVPGEVSGVTWMQWPTGKR